jgi:small subunit ribosomal protein S20
MANIKSQIKRNRQNEKRRVANKSVRSELKTSIKSAVSAAEAGDSAVAKDALRLAQIRIDKAASSGILKKETAARRKSQLTKQVNSLLG